MTAATETARALDPWQIARLERFNHETPEAGPAAAVDGSGGEAGAVVDPVDPGAVDPAGAQPSGPVAAPAWSPDQSPELIDSLAERIAGRLGIYGGDEGGGEQPEGVQLDPFADNFGEQLLGAFSQLLDQRLGPITAREQAQLVAEGRSQTIGQLQAMTDLGEFDHDRAFTRAQELTGELVQRLGTDDPRIVSPYLGNVLRQAAQDQATFEKSVREQAVKAYKDEMAAAANGGRPEPGVGGAGGPAPNERETYDDIVARHARAAERRRHETFQT